MTIIELVKVLFLKKTSSNKNILLKGNLILNLLYNPIASWFLIILDFVLLNTVDFDKSIVFEVFKNFWTYTFCAFLHFKKYNDIILIYTLFLL